MYPDLYRLGYPGFFQAAQGLMTLREMGSGPWYPPPHHCLESFCPLPLMSWGLGCRQPPSDWYLETPILAGSSPKPCLHQCSELAAEVPQKGMGERQRRQTLMLVSFS